MTFIANAAKLIAPVIEEDIIAGFNWVIEMLRTANLMEVESEVEIAKAVYFIKNKEIEKAIELFKSFEKKDHDGQSFQQYLFLVFLGK